MSEETFEKVFLHDRHGDVESCWCEPAGVAAGRHLFRLVNVPFAHAKPTFDDVIAARRDPEFAGNWAWDRAGVPFSKVGTLIHEDGGRYAAIVDYKMRPGGSFGTLVRWLKRIHDVVAEGCFGPRGREPGRVYLALPVGVDLDDVLAAMRAKFDAFTFARVHPPRKRGRGGKKGPRGRGRADVSAKRSVGGAAAKGRGGAGAKKASAKKASAKKASAKKTSAKKTSAKKTKRASARAKR